MSNVRFRICPLFKQTSLEKFQAYPSLEKKFEEFKATKMANHMAPFGNRDGMFVGDGLFNKAVPKLRHAHLTHDISIFYKVSGANPAIIELFGFFSHDDSGTGQPPNMKKQKSLAKVLANQVFS